MTRTTTAAAIAAASIAAIVIPAGAASASPAASLQATASGAPVYATIALRLKPKSYAPTPRTFRVHNDGEDHGRKGHISLQSRTGPHVKLRIISCDKKHVLSDWLLPPRSTHTYTGVKRNGKVATYAVNTCFRIQAWTGNGVIRGEVYS
ncbi:hypothetical protein [Actinoallomurus sp. CA-150999]|uniref:hypothetical protein n=1 Tax=Actinoallomurus sp. CA-150999 TaxID=3239887 RepID=UPI003D93BD6C